MYYLFHLRILYHIRKINSVHTNLACRRPQFGSILNLICQLYNTLSSVIFFFFFFSVHMRLGCQFLRKNTKVLDYNGLSESLRSAFCSQLLQIGQNIVYFLEKVFQFSYKIVQFIFSLIYDYFTAFADLILIMSCSLSNFYHYWH